MDTCNEIVQRARTLTQPFEQNMLCSNKKDCLGYIAARKLDGRCMKMYGFHILKDGETAWAMGKFKVVEQQWLVWEALVEELKITISVSCCFMWAWISTYHILFASWKTWLAGEHPLYMEVFIGLVFPVFLAAENGWQWPDVFLAVLFLGGTQASDLCTLTSHQKPEVFQYPLIRNTSIVGSQISASPAVNHGSWRVLGFLRGWKIHRNPSGFHMISSTLTDMHGSPQSICH